MSDDKIKTGTSCDWRAKSTVKGKFPRLYKYRSLAEGVDRDRTLQILETNELWYSRASGFNDPFDCNFQIDAMTNEQWSDLFGSGIEKLGNWLTNLVSGVGKTLLSDKQLQKLPKRQRPQKSEPRKWDITLYQGGRQVDTAEFFNRQQEKQLVKLYHLLDESFGVLSLSEIPDDILMWSHYANNHDGLCLEFDPNLHPKAFPRLNPVRYQDGYPYIPTFFPIVADMLRAKKTAKKDLLLDVANVLAENLKNSAENATETRNAALSIARWFYVKSSHWCYEREWRALESGLGPVRVTKRALKGIIVGCSNTEANLSLIADVVKDRRPRVMLYRAAKKDRQFGLDIVPV